MSCKACIHLGVTPDARGRIRVLPRVPYRCMAPAPELPALPIAFRDVRWPPSRSAVWADMGEGCPTFIDRKTKAGA